MEGQEDAALVTSTQLGDVTKIGKADTDVLVVGTVGTGRVKVVQDDVIVQN